MNPTERTSLRAAAHLDLAGKVALHLHGQPCAPAGVYAPGICEEVVQHEQVGEADVPGHVLGGQAGHWLLGSPVRGAWLRQLLQHHPCVVRCSTDVGCSFISTVDVSGDDMVVKRD